MLELRTLDAHAPIPGLEVLGSRGDILIGNDRAVAVIAALGNSNYLDAKGGAILDFAPRGSGDGIAEILQAVGILPEDSPDYQSMTLIDERPTRVAVQLRGTLLHKPDIAIYTLYEMRPCEPGMRVRTEVVNGTPEPQLWALSDGFYWSASSDLPFTPGPGFTYQSFGLTDIDGAYHTAPFLAASTHEEAPVSYAQVGCNIDQLEGFQSSTVSANGVPRTVIPSRAYDIFERFLFVTAGADVASAIDLALDARAQLHHERYATLKGSIGRPVSGERDIALLVKSGDRQITQMVPAADGSFSARVPAGGNYSVETISFGRSIGSRDLGKVDGDLDLGTLDGEARPSFVVTVKDDSGNPLDAIIYVVAADDNTRKATNGNLYGNYGDCAPWLGNPNGASPACDRFLVRGQTTVFAPAGHYYLYAYHGPFYSIARQTIDLSTDPVNADFTLQALPLQPTGSLSADLHVHGAASFDSVLPDYDRVLSFAAANVDVLVSTDHDVIHDYAAIVDQLGLSDRITTITGIETTGHIPYKYVPGDPFPRVIGHFNFWPLRHDPDAPRGGAPGDEFIEPGELFDRLDPIFTALPIMQLNHPWADVTFGRDQGFPRALGLKLYENLPAEDDGTPKGVYVRAPKGGHHNNDHHVQEVMNGTINDHLLQYRAFWFYVLNQGQIRTGTANSDSHSLSDSTIGTPRNLVFADTQAGPGFEIDRFNQALRDGRSFGTNGPIIEATLDGNSWSVHPFAPTNNVLSLQVSAAPWIPVDEIRIVVNGKVVKTIDNLPQPDPFGTDGLLRFSGDIDLTPLLPSGDCWVVIEAGDKLMITGDLDGDGVPDTSDNNGDGKVDQRDVAAGDTTGPLSNPTPTTDESDPHYHYSKIVTGGYPFAFSNPFVLDRNGNGKFDAPGAGK